MTRDDCRACGSSRLRVFLNLGETPLANAYPRPAELERADFREPRYPLRVALCTRCSLVQLTDTVPPEQLFSEYLYFSSYSTTMLEHARALADELVAARHLNLRNLVVEVASNDGYLLQWYTRYGVRVLGIEPARNVAAIAEGRGIRTRCAFFGAELARTLVAEGERADVLHAHNVLAHVADLPGFVEGVATLLAPAGEAVIEVPYIHDLLDTVSFDTIYHEHLCYFSLTALDSLFSAHGLRIVDVVRDPIHGGSLRLYIEPMLSGTTPRGRVQRLLDEERAWGVLDPETYASFGARTERLRQDLADLLRRLRAEGKRVAAYGAAAKGTTLLTAAGIGRDLVSFVVDRSPHKQGRLMPGSHIPIFSPERLLEEQPDYVLLLTWNFADEIMAQQAEYRARGGRFILPVPTPRIE